MASKIENTQAKFEGNVYPGMLQSLSEQLGVPAEALAQFHLGWAPVVGFKRGSNYQGWWSIPERDATGVVTGLSLRSQTGMKVMYPGSKHGLAYPLNPAHDLSRPDYQHGAHNWVRLMDAGIDCPVCEKPDGCLVSAENPEDPKACICIRRRENAARPMKFGYLHILKESGKISTGASVLPASRHPVIVVEGFSDAATAVGMGFVGVGRPSNLACMDMLADLVRGRDVIVLGENDDINPTTGKRPGHEGMIATFQVLKRVCPNIRMALPPDHLKDLRGWQNANALTASQLLAYVEAEGRTSTETTVLEDHKPLTIARNWLDAQYRMAGRYTLRYYKGQWFRYAGARYLEVDEDTEIRGPLYGWCDDKMVKTETAQGTKLDPLVCHKGTVNNVMDALLHPCPVTAADIPQWINGASGPHPDDMVAFSNGLLWLPKFLSGADESEYLLDHTPDLFNVFALPFPFDPTAECPRWRQYLDETLGDEPDKIKLMREWYGYCMTSDTKMHKLMLMRGPKRSGKGTAAAVLQAIVGQDQCASTSFAQLTGNFGLEGLVGKQLALMGDARLPRNGDSMRALEILLNIVGEDPVNVDRKFKKPLANHRLKCRFTIATNELPELPDHAGAMEARLNILDFTRCFVGREDFDLRDKLVAEAPGIAVWALEGLRRLRKQGRFTVPASSRASLQEWRTATSPTSSFIEECCDQGQDLEVHKAELYDAWDAWSRERGMKPITKSRFFERVKANAQFAHSDTYVEAQHKHSVYKGLALRKWAEKQYLGKMS